MSSSFCLYLRGWWAECDDCGWINVKAHTIYSSFSWPQEYKVLGHKNSTHFTTIMKIIPSMPCWENLKDPMSVWSKLKILHWISGAQLRIPVSQVLIMSQSCLKVAAGQQVHLNTVSWKLNCNINSRDYQASYKLWYRFFSLA